MTPLETAWAEVPWRYDELRIIADDEKRLDQRDRTIIKSAADEMEASFYTVALLITKLRESEQHLAAVTEQLKEKNKLPQMQFPTLSGKLSGELIRTW